MSEIEKRVAEATQLIEKAAKQGKADYVLGYIKGAIDAEEKHSAKEKGE
nr:MAG TPA: hypothetical protein [Bacteriophage sp.]